MTATSFAHETEGPWVESDLDAMPDNGNRYEIIEGRLIVTPPGTDFHGSTQGRLFAAILAATPEGFSPIVECGVRIPGGNVIADIGVLKPLARRGVVWRDAADLALVVEIASPATEQFDATDKLVGYARAGIPTYWRVTQNGTAFVYELDGEAYREVHRVDVGEVWEATTPFRVVLRPTDWR